MEWWIAQGADLLAQDVDGGNAIQAASSLPMSQWLLDRGAPTDGKRRWDGRIADSMARSGQWALLRCMVAYGADLSSLGWSPLHQLLALGSDAERNMALTEPQRVDWLHWRRAWLDLPPSRDAGEPNNH